MLGGVIRLAGIPVRTEDARARSSPPCSPTTTPDGLKAAARIAHALDVDAAIVALTVQQRDPVRAALEGPAPGLGELRDALVQRARRQGGAPRGREPLANVESRSRNPFVAPRRTHQVQQHGTKEGL